MSIVLSPEVERRILAQVERGQYSSPSQVVQQGLDLLELQEKDRASSPGTATHEDPPIWQQLLSLADGLPSDEWANVPTDLSKNVDHYLYGNPKES